MKQVYFVIAAVPLIGLLLLVGCGDRDGRPSTSQGHDDTSTQMASPVPEGGYTLSITAISLGGGQVELKVTSNVPGSIEVMAGVSVAGQKPDDPYIGVDQKVILRDGSGKVVLNTVELPSGDYEAEVDFYPRWGFKDQESRRTGITERLHSSVSIKLAGSGETVDIVLQRLRGQRWVMENIAMGNPWDPTGWRRRFGHPVEITVTRLNPAIIEAYYFPTIDMTIIVNVLKHEIVTWRMGRASS